jgi:hypothetical protein
MIYLTRPQRVAVKRIYDRGPMDINGDPVGPGCLHTPITYREFRRKAQPVIGCSGVAMIYARGMFIGIEPDGYAHT